MIAEGQSSIFLSVGMYGLPFHIPEVVKHIIRPLCFKVSLETS